MISTGQCAANAIPTAVFPTEWAVELPEPQRLPVDLVAEGHAIPIARVQAMHEGKRRKRAREA